MNKFTKLTPKPTSNYLDRVIDNTLYVEEIDETGKITLRGHDIMNAKKTKKYK